MPEVQNIGAADYAQYQPSQYSPEEAYTENYNTQPEVYNEGAEQMKTASKSRLGATLLSGAIVAGLALWGGHAWGKKSAKAEVDKAITAIEQYEKAQKAMEEFEQLADEKQGKFFGNMRIGRELHTKMKELFKPFKKVSEEAKDEVKETAETVAEDASKKTKKGKSSAEAKRPTHS